MTSLFVCYEHKLYKKKFTSVINEQVFVTIHPAQNQHHRFVSCCNEWHHATYAP